MRSQVHSSICVRPSEALGAALSFWKRPEKLWKRSGNSVWKELVVLTSPGNRQGEEMTASHGLKSHLGVALCLLGLHIEAY